MHAYRLYGITLESEIPLPELAPVAIRPAGHREKIIFSAGNFRSRQPAEMIAYRGLSYWLSRDGKRGRVSSRAAGTFHLDFVERKVAWKPALGAESAGFARMLLKGKVLGFFLSCMPDRLLLHASVVCRDGRAILFCGAGGQGKSTMTAAFLNRAFHLLSDDTAVIRQAKDRLAVESGAPEIRLWPESLLRLKPKKLQAAPLYAQTVKKRCVLNGSAEWKFIQKPAYPAAVYVLSREKDGGIIIEDLKGRNALTALLQNIYLPIIKNPGLSAAQFGLIAQLIRQVPVKRLRYPSGYRHLPAIQAALSRDRLKK